MKGEPIKGKQNKNLKQTSSNWLKNITKSLGYATLDIIEDTIPSIYEFGSDNLDTVNEIMNSFRDSSGKEAMISQGMEKISPLMRVGGRGLQYALEDIKSGKFYNKERADEITKRYDDFAEDDMFNFDDEDFDFGDDFGDDDFDEDDIFNFDDEESDAQVIVKPIKIENRSIANTDVLPAAKMISTMNAENTVGTMTAIKGVADQNKIFETQKIIREADFNNTLFGVLSVMSDNIGMIVSFKDNNEAKFITTGMEFFGTQIDLMNQIVESVKKDERTPGEIKDEERAKNINSTPDIFLSEGGLDLGEYGKNLIKNFKNMDIVSDAGDMLSLFVDSDEEDLERLVQNPLSFIPKFIVKQFIPQSVLESSKLIDRTFSSFTGALMAKFNNWASDETDDEGLIGVMKKNIGQLFGYNVDKKNDVDLGQYEKGAISFDGITKKAIVDVIPTYLRRIEAAITNTEERAYNFETGKFESMTELRKSYDKSMQNISLRGQGDIISKINKSLNETGMSDDAKESFMSDVTNYFKKMQTEGRAINPFISYDLLGNEIDELDNADVFDDRENLDLFRRIISNFDKSDIMKMTGTNIFDGIRAKRREYEDMEMNPYKNGFMYFNNNSLVKSDYTIDRGTGEKIRRNVFDQVDSYGENSLKYVRDIRSILLNGVTVFMGGEAPTSVFDDPHAEIRKSIEKENKYKSDKENEKDTKVQNKRAGKTVSDLLNLPETELNEKIFTGLSEEEQARNNAFLAMLQPKSKTPIIGGIKNLYQDGLVEFMDKASTKINNFLYSIIFGSDESKYGEMDSYLDAMKVRVSAFHAWTITNVYNPVKDAIIGPNGLITKIKDSKFFKKITEKKNILIDKLLGEKDEKGDREGGIFSTARNSIVDFFKAVKHSLTGESYTDSKGNRIAQSEDAIFTKIKKTGQTLWEKSKNFLMGGDGQEGILKRAYGSFMDGLENFRESLFGKAHISGYKSDGRKTMGEFADSIKQNLPKAAAKGLLMTGAKMVFASKLGLLGSIIMPGGPIGTLLTSTAVSLVTQSETFKKWAFGEKDPEDPSKRMGGFIPKSLQDFYHENKIRLGVGAGAGALASFFLPGGMIFGALMGTGVSIATKSNAFQEFLYGPDFDKGPKSLMNGFFGNAYKKFRNKLDEYGIDPKLATFLGGIGAGAGALGLLPSFFMPGGPIGGALLGMAGGIFASSDKFQTWLFGEKDFDGKRSGGIIDKFKTFFDIEILDSLKITMKEWNMKFSDFLYDHIAEPFLSGLEPMKQILIDAANGVKNMFTKGWEWLKNDVLGVFKDNVIKPFGDSLKRYVVDPLKKMLKGTFSMFGKFIGGIISAPFKVFGWLGKRADATATTDEEKEKRDKVQKAREERLAKREERRAKVQEEIKDMKEKQEKDREFFRKDGRFRNQEQKEKWETEQKEKQLFYQQHIAESGAEAADKLDTINKALESLNNVNPSLFYSLEQNIVKELRNLRGTAMDQLSYFKREGFIDTRYLRTTPQVEPIHSGAYDRQLWLNTAAEKDIEEVEKTYKPSVMITNDPKISNEAKRYQDPTINSIIGILRQYGQSHDTGLDEVPYDGYVAELHKGERIIPADKVENMKVFVNGGYLDGIRTANEANKNLDAQINEEDQLSELEKIAKRTKKIYNFLDDNAHGMGWNLMVIRKLLQYMTGVSADDAEKINDLNIPDRGIFGHLFHKTRRMFSNVFETVTEKVKGVFDFITHPFKTIYKTFKSIFGAINSTLQKIIEIPGRIIGAVTDVAVDLIKKGSGLLFNVLEKSVNGIATVVSDVYKGSRWLVTTIATNFVPIVTGAGKLIGSTISGIAKAFGFTIDTVTSLAKGIATATKDIASAAYNFGKDIVKGAWNIGKDIATGIFNVGKEIISAPFKFIGSLFNKITGKKDVQLVKVVGGTVDKVKFVGEVGADILNDAPDLTNDYGREHGLVEGIWNATKNLASGVLDVGSSILSAPFRLFGSTFDKIRGNKDKKVQLVEVVGGYLDTVKIVETCFCSNEVSDVPRRATKVSELLPEFDFNMESTDDVEEVEETFKDRIWTIKDKMQNTLSSFSDLFVSTFDSISEKMMNVKTSIGDKFNSFSETANNKLDTFKGSVSSAVSSIKENFKPSVETPSAATEAAATIINDDDKQDKKEPQTAKEVLEEQVKVQEKIEKEKAADEKAKADREDVSKKNAEFMQNKKKEEKKELMLAEYHAETQTDIDSTEKVLTKQYDFWFDLFGKNGKVSTFLSGIWEAITKLAPLLFNWFKGTGFGKALGGIFKSLFGGLGLKDLIVDALAVAAPFLVGNTIDNLDKGERDKRAEEYNLTDTEAYLGVGKESRYAGEEEGYILNGSRLEHKTKVTKNLVRDMWKKDIPHRIYETGKSVVQRGTKLGKSAIEKGKNSVVGKTVNNVVSSMKNKFSGTRVSVSLTDDLVSNVGDDVVETVGDELLDVDGKSIKNVTASLVNVADDVATENKGLVKKFLSLLDDAVKKIVEFVGGKLGKPGLASKVDDVVKPIISKLTGKIDDIILKYCPKIASFLGVTAAGTATAFILDAGFAIWDLATGQTKSETANLFGVKPEQVNAKMRIISAALKALGKFSWIEVVYLASEITADLLGINFMRWIAGLIYKAVSSDAEDAQLDANQDAMEAEWKAYNEENGTNLSKEAYIDMQAPTVFEKMINSKAMQAITKPFSKSGAANALGKDVDDVTFGDRLKYLGGMAVNGAMNMFLPKSKEKTISEFFGKGKLKTDEKGNVITDENGNPTYYTEDELTAMYGENAGMGDMEEQGSGWGSVVKKSIASTLVGGPLAGLATTVLAKDPNVKKFFNNLADKTAEWLGFEIDDTKGLLSNLSAGFNALKDKVKSWWTRDDNDINEALGKEKGSKVNILQRKGWGAVKAFNWAANFFRDEDKKLTTVEEFKKIKETFSKIGESIWGWLTKGIENVKNIMNTIKDGFSSVKETISGWLGFAQKEVDTVNENDATWGDKFKNTLKRGWNVVKSVFRLPAYEQGTPWVPDTQVALLHEGEMVVPADYNPFNSENNNIENQWLTEAAYTVEKNEMIVPVLNNTQGLPNAMYYEDYFSPTIEEKPKVNAVTDSMEIPEDVKAPKISSTNDALQMVIKQQTADNAQQERWVRDIISSINGIDINPIVNVSSPSVNVTSTDYSEQISRIETKLDDIKTVDETQVEATEVSTEILKNKMMDDVEITKTDENASDVKEQSNTYKTLMRILGGYAPTTAYIGDYILNNGTGIEKIDEFTKKANEWTEEKTKNFDKWVTDKYNTAKDWTVENYNTAKDWTVDKYNIVKDKTVEGYNILKDKTIDGYNIAKDWTVDKYNIAKDKTIDTYNTAKDTLVNYYKEEKQKSENAAEIMLGDNKAEANILTDALTFLTTQGTSVYNKTIGQMTGNELNEDTLVNVISKNIHDKIVEPFRETKKENTDKFNDIKETVGNWIDEKKNLITNAYTEKIKEPFINWAEEKEDQFEELKENVVNWMDDKKTLITDTYTNKIKEPFKNWLSTKKSQFDTMKKNVINWMDDKKTLITDTYTNKIKEPFKNWLSEKKTQFNEMKENVINWMDDKKTLITDTYTNKIKEPFKNWVTTKKKQFDEMANAAKEWVNAIKDKILDGFNKYVKEPFNGVVSGIVSVVQPLIDLLGKIPGINLGETINNLNAESEAAKQEVNATADDNPTPEETPTDNTNLGTGSAVIKPLRQQIKPRKYIFNENDVKYTASDAGKTVGKLRDKGNTHNFPYYSQLDGRWGRDKLTNKTTIGRSGCGPTSAAMVLTHLTGQYITPDTMARLGEQHLPGYTTYGYFPDIANKFKLSYNEIGPNDNQGLASQLRSGRPVILSGFDPSNSGASPFTDEGHIVVATGMDGNLVEINDPRGPAYSGSYDLNDIMRGLKRGFVYGATGETAKLQLPTSGLYNNDVEMVGDYTEMEAAKVEPYDVFGETGAAQVTVADRVLSYARAFLQNTSKFKYSQAQSTTTGRHGIDHNNIGADCSSFVSHVISVAGDTGKISYLSQSFWDEAGYKVDPPQIGDVVCQQGHVGLYSGNGMYIHMSGKRDGIKESKAIQRGNNPHRGYKRVLKNPSAMVDPTIVGGNSLLGTVVATASGNPVTSGGTTPTTSTDGSTDATAAATPQVDELGVFGQLSNAVSNLVASMYNGKQVDLFGATSTTGSTDTSNSATPAVTGSGTFPKYNLTEQQIKGLANIVQHEQPGVEGRHAEASLMANLTDIKGDEYATTENLIKKVTGGWFAKGKSRFENPGNPEQISIDAVRSVLVEGKRTIPRYIDEHDCFSDLTSTTNNGTSFKVSDRSQYKPHVTKIKNRYGSSGTFFTFPNSKSDPFYYTSEANRQKWGDNCYSVGSSTDATVDTNAGTGDMLGVPEELLNAGMGDALSIRELTNLYGENAGSEGELSVRELTNLYGENAGMDPETTTTGGTTPGGIPTSMNNFAYYKQSDPTWNESLINGHSISKGGCGPTTLAMIATQLSGKIITPVTMAKAAEKAGHWKGLAYWDLFPWFGDKFGLQTKVIGSNDLKTAKEELSKGNVIAVSGKTVRKGSHTPYTSGHIVPFIGLDGSNKIIVNDSRGPEYAHAYDDSGLAQGTTNHMRQAWSYSGQIKIPSDIEVSGDYTGGGGVATGPQATLDKVLLIGDSLTAGIKSTLNAKYPNAQALGKPGKWAMHWLDSLSELPDPESVDTVIQWLGINGVGSNSTNMTKSQELLTKLKEKYTGKPIFNMDIFPTTKDYSSGGQSGEWWKTSAQEFNQGMSTWTSANGVHQLNATSGMILEDGFLDPTKAVDGIHFTNEGYQQVLSNIEGGFSSYNSSLGSGSTGTSSGSAPQVDELGVFDQLSRAISNLVASMYNGKQVDLFGATSTTGSTDNSGGGLTPGQDISGISDYEQAVWTYFTTRGYTPQATAGIMGNMYQESGVNPTVIQGGGKGPAAGICQWENINTGGARWGILKQYADSKGVDWKDLQTQLEYLEMELAGDQSKIKVDTYTSTLVKKRGGLQALKSMTNAEDAMYFFEETFERAGKPNYPRRKKAVAEYMAKFGGTAGTGGRYSTIIEPMSRIIDKDEVYYSQNDENWNTTVYDGNMVSSSGCGPTTLAMIASQLTGADITPDMIARAAYEDGVWSDSASWDIFPWFANQFGLEYKISGSNDVQGLNEMLTSDYKVAVSGKLHEKTSQRSPFTTEGHIVPIVGVQGTKYTINDPRGFAYKGDYEIEDIINPNSDMRAAYGFKATSKTKDYLANSRFSPELLAKQQEKEIQAEEEAIVALGATDNRQFNASELYKNAGMGEGTTTSSITHNIVRTFKPESISQAVSKPVSDIDVKVLDKLKGISQNNTNTITQESEMGYIKACLESLNIAVEELKSINENTKQTAENVSNIKIYSANEPINQNAIKNTTNDKLNRLGMPNGDKSGRVQSKDTQEYKIARLIASFKK